MKKLSYIRLTPKATKLLDILDATHSDIVGPFQDSFYGLI